MIMDLTRRAFLGKSGLGAAALAWMMGGSLQAQVARAKRVIFLFQFGGPSQFELFDPKAELHRRDGARVDPGSGTHLRPLARPGEAAGRRAPGQVRAARRLRASDQRSPSAHGPHRG